jgi:transposase
MSAASAPESTVYAAVDALGQLLAFEVTAADEQGRAFVERLAEEVQRITDQSVELAYVYQGYSGEDATDAAAKHGIQLEVVKHTEATAALFCCSEDGWRNVAAPEPPASADWPETTNASPPTWQATTTSPSPGSCLPSLSCDLTEVYE